MERTQQTAMLSLELIELMSLSYSVLKVDLRKTIGLISVSQPRSDDGKS
jgi:hypothetical protein